MPEPFELKQTCHVKARESNTAHHVHKRLRLEMIVKESSQCYHHASAEGQGVSAAAAGGASDIPHLGEATAQDPLGLYFVSYRQQRDLLPDGRRRHRYLLMDQHGGEHLAVTGDCSHARDGHYTYLAVGAWGCIWAILFFFYRLV